MKVMPNVYRDSYIVQSDLEKYPADGEREILEQEDSVQTAGSVRIPEATFLRWMDCHSERDLSSSVAKYPCAAVIMQYAKDQQGTDIRGGVTGDSAWELCCRLLTETSTFHLRVVTSGDLAQLIVLV